MLMEPTPIDEIRNAVEDATHMINTTVVDLLQPTGFADLPLWPEAVTGYRRSASC